MEMRNSYIINQDTVLIKSEFDSNGYHCSQVIQGKDTFLVRQKPSEILDYSMMHYGTSDLQGGIRTARYLLGNISMCPISVCSQLDFYWFPLYSPKNEKCIWLSRSHVLKPEKLSPFKTRVHLKFGHSFEVDIKISRFKEKYGRATDLKLTIQERTKKVVTYFYEPHSGFQLVSESAITYKTPEL
ncbi:competence protein ComK [Peribacillus deserti]|uniref:Competence protein ComK n=1 Tax=Peribacillus deserti TaxID=673318 RepID=A0ABS2QFM5_9BACI|nr:competence protein ComK [Peribacillus deserti]MBM7691604.1 competence protein ComK [Peribacillus deserti]